MAVYNLVCVKPKIQVFLMTRLISRCLDLEFDLPDLLLSCLDITFNAVILKDLLIGELSTSWCCPELQVKFFHRRLTYLVTFCYLIH